MKITRTLFWFTDETGQLVDLTNRFFGLGTLLNRLMNEHYHGKRMQFINLNFLNKEAFAVRPKTPKDEPYYYGGHLTYYGEINYHEFYALTEEGQYYFVWQRGYEYLQASARSMKSDALLSASQYAYEKGLAMRLTQDYKLVESDVVLYGQKLHAAVWVLFKKNGMFSRFVLEKDGQMIFEKDIDGTKLGVEIFLEVYKSIEVSVNAIILKGRRDIPYLPLTIPVAERVVNDF